MRGLYDDNSGLPTRAEAINANKFLPLLLQSNENPDMGYVIDDKQFELLCFFRGQILRYKDSISTGNLISGV